MIIVVSIIHAVLAISVYSFCWSPEVMRAERLSEIDGTLLFILISPLCSPFLYITADLGPSVLISFVVNSLFWGSAIIFGFKFLKKKLSKNCPLVIALLIFDVLLVYFIYHLRFDIEYQLVILISVVSLWILIFQIIICCFGYFGNSSKNKIRYFFAIHVLVSLFLAARELGYFANW